MQAGIPGVLLAPNDNPEAQRTAGGILAGPIHLQFVYPALDGYVSITLLFGTMIGPFTAPADGVGARRGPLRRGDARLGLARRSACAW